MKWALAQLNRYGNQKFHFETTMDFSGRLANTDILSISECKVNGEGKKIDGDHYEFEINIECVCVVEDSITLEPINYPVKLCVTEEFDSVDSGNVNLVQGQTIELDDVVWQNIYLSIPMRIVKSDLDK